jgi:hypothetical protein
VKERRDCISTDGRDEKWKVEEDIKEDKEK